MGTARSVTPRELTTTGLGWAAAADAERSSRIARACPVYSGHGRSQEHGTGPSERSARRLSDLGLSGAEQRQSVARVPPVRPDFRPFDLPRSREFAGVVVLHAGCYKGNRMLHRIAVTLLLSIVSSNASGQPSSCFVGSIGMSRSFRRAILELRDSTPVAASLTILQRTVDTKQAKVVTRSGTSLSMELDSPDQSVMNLPMTAARLTGDSIHLDAEYLGAAFHGVIDGENRISGTWTQSGAPSLLTVTRADSATSNRRPQDPVAPFPYHSEELRFSGSGGVRLAGTLTRPNSGGPHPTILLLSGSGPQDRNETVAGHRPFLVIADRLTRAGFAVLRVDDRGTGGGESPLADPSNRAFPTSISTSRRRSRLLFSRPSSNGSASALP
jgi:hypothetical protein